MQPHNHSDVVPGVLARMEHLARLQRMAILGAAVVEGALFLFVMFRMNWSDDTHVLLFVLSVLGYTIVLLGMVALGAHISRVGARVVAAFDDRDHR